MNSLERNLQGGLLATLLIVLFVFGWTVSLTARMLAQNYVFDELKLLVLEATENFSVLPNDDLFLQAKRQPKAQTQLILQVTDTMLVLPDDAQLWRTQVPELVPGATRRVSIKGSSSESDIVHAWFAGYTLNGSPYVVGAVKDATQLHAKISAFQWYTAGVLSVLIVAVIGVQRYIVRRAMSKLDDIRRDMLRLERGHAVALSQDVPAEVLPLVLEFNNLLRRFEQRLRQSRNAVGNLAHSLKGPLNLLVRSSEADEIDSVERENIKNHTNAIRLSIEGELKRARLAGRSAVGVRFDIDAELPAMIGLLEQIYADKSLSIKYTVERSVEVLHDRQDMLELIGNLLDNAAKWCTSEVRLSVQSSNGVVIDVQDDGPGCSPEMLGRLTDRGVRLDESVAGHGLGLSIVNDILDTYRGNLSLSISEQLGGLKATAFLPSSQFESMD